MDCCLPVPPNASIVCCACADSGNQMRAKRRERIMKRKLTWFLGTVIVGVATYAGTLLATPGSGFTGTTLAAARFDEIDLHAHTVPDFWQSKLQTKGLSDLYVQSNVWAPGGTTGWHTHPGPSLIIVTAGAVPGHQGGDGTRPPPGYSKGVGFIGVGNGHIPVVRKDSSIEARA